MIISDAIAKLSQLANQNKQDAKFYTSLRQSMLAIDRAELAASLADLVGDVHENQVRELWEYWYFFRLEQGFEQVIGNLGQMSSFALLGLICRWRAGDEAESEYADFARTMDSLLKKIWLDLDGLAQASSESQLHAINQHIQQSLNLRIQNSSDTAEHFCLDQVFKQGTIAYLALLLLFYLVCENLNALNNPQASPVNCYSLAKSGTPHYTLGFDQEAGLWLYDILQAKSSSIHRHQLPDSQLKCISKPELLQTYLQTLADTDHSSRTSIYRHILSMFNVYEAI